MKKKAKKNNMKSKNKPKAKNNAKAKNSVKAENVVKAGTTVKETSTAKGKKVTKATTTAKVETNVKEEKLIKESLAAKVETNVKEEKPVKEKPVKEKPVKEKIVKSEPAPKVAEKQKDPKKDKKKKSGFLKFFNIKKIAIAVALVYILGLFLFSNRVVPNTNLDDFSVSMVGFNKLGEHVNADIATKELVIDDVVIDGKKISYGDLGVSIDQDRLVEDIKSNQTLALWPLEIIAKSTFDYKDYLVVDADAVSTTLSDAGYFGKDNRKIPGDAEIKLDEEKAEFVVVSAKKGTLIDSVAFTDAVVSTLQEQGTKIDTEAHYIPASNNLEEINKQVESLNSRVNRDVSMKIGDSTVKVPKLLVAQSIFLDVDGSVAVNGAELFNYLYEESLEFDSTDIGFGYRKVVMSDMSPAYDEIVEGLISEGTGPIVGEAPITNIDEKFSPTVQTSAATYIEISIDQQMMWVFQGGELLVQTPIVTGNLAQGWYTPRGTYSVISKETNKVLRGETVGFDYEVPVNYWMRLTNTGIGIHDIGYLNDDNAWNYRSRYLANGSHGCINTPGGAMAKIYANIPPGTPVYIV